MVDPERAQKLTLVVNSLLDPSLPLLRRSSVQQSDNHHCHVVASDTAGLGIGGQAFDHEIFADLAQVVAIGNSSSDKVDDLLGGKTVPDTYR